MTTIRLSIAAAILLAAGAPGAAYPQRNVHHSAQSHARRQTLLRQAWQLLSCPNRGTARISVWTSGLRGGFREIGAVDFPSVDPTLPPLEQLSWSPDQRLLGFVLANVLCVVRASQ